MGEDCESFKEGLFNSGFQGPSFIQTEFTTELGQRLGSSVKSGDIVVIKGSRGAQTEKFIPFCEPVHWENK